MNLCEKMVLAARASNTDPDKIKAALMSKGKTEEEAERLIIDVFAQRWEGSWDVVKLWAETCQLTTDQMMDLTESDAIAEDEAVDIDKKLHISMPNVPESVADELSEMVDEELKAAKERIEARSDEIARAKGFRRAQIPDEVQNAIGRAIDRAPKELRPLLVKATAEAIKKIAKGDQKCLCGKCHK